MQLKILIEHVLSLFLMFSESGPNRILSSLKFKKIRRAKECSHIELLKLKGENFSNRFLFY